MRQQLGITEETPKIADYEILRCIGVGGYGKVYLARDSLGGYCAIKLVRHAASVQDKAYEREMHGLQLYSSISRLHDGFVDVLHIGRNDGSGKMYLARDSLGGYCAIKLVRHAASVQDKAYERELHGLQLYSSISRLHEGFVDVLHIGRNDGYGYFYY